MDFRDTPFNDIKLALTLSALEPAMREGVRKWILSGCSGNSYTTMINHIRDSTQTVKELGLVLLALLCYERLAPHDNIIAPVNDSYLSCFDAMLQRKQCGNKQDVLEHMSWLFLCFMAFPRCALIQLTTITAPYFEGRRDRRF